jgi:catechol 2,3-dioxygenase-like lactoylglutathione lyase family enzyme
LIVISIETESLRGWAVGSSTCRTPIDQWNRPQQIRWEEHFSRSEAHVKLDLLSPGIEVGLVTTNLEAMIAFYEGFLELEFQGEIEFPGGSQRRYSLGGSVLKLVTFTTPPPLPVTPGGGRAAAGVRYFTIGVKDLTGLSKSFADSPHEVVEPLTEFAPVPGMGWMFVADPDGNWIELFGTL